MTQAQPETDPLKDQIQNMMRKILAVAKENGFDQVILQATDVAVPLI